MSKSKKRHEEHEEHADETWLIPYADLLTLLLALFIVLYAMSSANISKFEDMSKAFNIALSSGVGVLQKPSIRTIGEDLEKKDKAGDSPNNEAEQKKEDETHKELMKKEQEDLEKLKKSIDEYIEKNGLNTQLETKLNHSQLMITISDNALFASGSAALRPQSINLATAIAAMLQQYPGYEVVVAGHTDNLPIKNAEFDSNWNLSSARALNFMKIFFNNHNLDQALFSAVGYGEYRTIDTNDTTAGRSKNRRVEVSILRKYKSNNEVVTVGN